MLVTSSKVKPARGKAREHILITARFLLLSQGAGSLALDALLREAGLSKGAFFHNFKSKDELLLELVKRASEEVESISAKLPACPGKDSFLRSYIQTLTMEDLEPAKSLRFLCLAFLEILITAPHLADTLSQFSAEVFQSITPPQAHPERVLLLVSAADGFWFDNALGLRTWSPELKRKTVDLLLELVDSGWCNKI